MSRKRMLSPDVWTDDGFLRLSMPARVLWFGLISHADDEGRGTASVRSLRARVFPADGVSDDDLVAMKADVQKNMRCTFYEHDGIEYYQLLKWHDHQKVNRPTGSTIPPLTDNSVSTHLEVEEVEEVKEVDKCAKRTYAPNVSLSPEEHEDLVRKHGGDVVSLAIELLDAYKAEKGKRYKSDAGALRSWGIQAALERRDKQRKAGPAPPKGRVCPKCGEVNRHTGGMCLKCGEDLPRGKG